MPGKKRTPKLVIPRASPPKAKLNGKHHAGTLFSRASRLLESRNPSGVPRKEVVSVLNDMMEFESALPYSITNAGDASKARIFMKDISTAYPSVLSNAETARLMSFAVQECWEDFNAQRGAGMSGKEMLSYLFEIGYLEGRLG